ncbi:phage antirepressor KilAC domain-containing protein [Fusobacterium varium]|uniref:phage antirepressor KilAC domain-containing protein n=1 Tax=Fusobacterium varium TaxID=856 RepID=UPI0030D40DDF
MNNLIKIEERNEEQLVSARDLHKFLEIKTRFNDWFLRMCEYGFVENKDYIAITQKRVTAQGNETTYTDYLMKISMAKEISMLQRNTKGKEAREYFIKCEEAWNSEDMIMARAMEIQNKKILNYREEVKKLEAKLEEQKPQVMFAEAVTASKDSILIRELAKILKQNGYDTGEKRMFAWLREQGYLIKKEGADYNLPTQRAMDLGLFEIKKTAINHSNGEIEIKKTPKITGKGQIYFINKLINKIA